ncbi:MAG: DUF4097 domain-containing protein [Acidimicrobiia bacterium]|nr:DUF4097 domain-containing protein [Acidimicrobiia bacterium]
MSRVERSFAVTGRPRLEVKVKSGDIRIRQSATDDVVVVLDGSDKWLERISIDQIGDDTIRVEATGRTGLLGRVEVVASVPAGSDVDIKVESADVFVDVDVTELRVGVGSGDVRAGLVTGNAQIKAGSGDIHIDEIQGDLEVSVASGDVRVKEVLGDTKAKGASGDIVLERVAGRVEGSTASGDITIRAFEGPDLRVTALAGDVTLGIPAGRTLDVQLQTMSGDVINDLGAASGERTGAASLRIKTMAGDIRLKPAKG